MKIRVSVMRQSFFEIGGSGFVKIARSPRTQGRLFCKVSQPPTSIVALMSTMADHLPWMVRSWSKVERRVRNLCTATDASEDVLALDV
jgi:hypothetical protein